MIRVVRRPLRDDIACAIRVPDKNKAHLFQHATNLARLKNRGLRHELGRNGNTLGAYELGVQLRVAVLQQHLDDFTKVAM
jgi:hypothetical protein